MRRDAFTFMEVLVVLGVLAALSGLSMPVYRGYQVRSDLQLAQEQVLQGLGRAQFLAQWGERDSAWGFDVTNGTVFKGDSYDSRDASFDETYALPGGITASGVTEVVFSQLDGLPNISGSVILVPLYGDPAFLDFLHGDPVVLNISVESGGSIDVPGDKLTICHYPPGNPENPQTLQISDNAWPAHQKHGDTVGTCDNG